MVRAQKGAAGRGAIREGLRMIGEVEQGERRWEKEIWAGR